MNTASTKEAKEELLPVWIRDTNFRAALGDRGVLAPTNRPGRATARSDKFGPLSKYSRAELLGQLAEKLILEELLAELSTRFFTLASEQIEGAIGEMQQLIGETLGLDRGTLWQFPAHEAGMVCTHCWQRTGCPGWPSRFRASEGLPWTIATIMRGEVISISSLAELPLAAGLDVENLHQQGVKSKVAFPLMANGQVFGALSFATLGVERKWRKDEIATLRLIAQILANVLGRQRAEMREGALRNELAHAMRVATLGELGPALAHELNQPLAAILSNAQAARRFIAEDGIEPDELCAILDDIVRADKRAGNIIHHLRTMISKRPLVHEVCDLNQIVRGVFDLMHTEMKNAAIEVRLALTPNLPRVLVASVELEQVLVNLLMNAVQAMKATPAELRWIDVATRSEAEGVVVTVRDRGHGIASERLPAVFDPCVSTKESGLGMGLSICRRIIESFAGRIEACNHEDGGAVFSFTLPIPVSPAK